MKSKTGAYLTIIGGGILMLLSIPHALLGYPGISDNLQKANVSNELTHAVQIIWVFSSIAMLQFGIWGLILGYKLLKTQQIQRTLQLVLGLGITLFSFIGFFHAFPNWSVTIFLAPGILLLIPTLFLES